MTSVSGVRERAIEEAAAILGPLAERDVPLGPLTTYRVGGPAALLARIEAPADLAHVHAALAATDLPVLIVGRGSNLLVADHGFPGLAVVLGAFALEVRIDGCEVLAGASVSLPVLARQTVTAGLTGLEWAVGVPGSVGGGVRMNAGGHGSDVASTLVGVRVFDLCSGEDGEVPASALGLRFRGSDLVDHQIVLTGRFGLDAGRPRRVRGVAGRDRALAAGAPARWAERRVRLREPGTRRQLSAGEVIDELGLRGLRIGTAEVSPKHANFIQADEGGRADDVRALMAVVRARVLEARGIALRSEIRQIGFDDRDDGVRDREADAVKLFGRQKAQALAAGTVAPDDVFVSPSRGRTWSPVPSPSSSRAVGAVVSSADAGRAASATDAALRLRPGCRHPGGGEHSAAATTGEVPVIAATVSRPRSSPSASTTTWTRSRPPRSIRARSTFPVPKSILACARAASRSGGTKGASGCAGPSWPVWSPWP